MNTINDFKNRIICDDYLKVVSRLPPESVDMVITDPPYGTTRNKWDRALDWARFWIAIERITKPGAAVLVFSQMPALIDAVNHNRANFRYEWIWQKERGTGFLNANRMPMKAHENILVFYDSLPVYNPQKRQGKPYTATRANNSETYGTAEIITTVSDGGRYPLDIIKVNADKDRHNNKMIGKLHPTAKPVELYEYMIRTYTNEGALVLDTFAGCCPLALAATNTKRDFICIEKETQYCDIGNYRLNKLKNENT